MSVVLWVALLAILKAVPRADLMVEQWGDLWAALKVGTLVRPWVGLSAFLMVEQSEYN